MKNLGISNFLSGVDFLETKCLIVSEKEAVAIIADFPITISLVLLKHIYINYLIKKYKYLKIILPLV